MPFPFFSRGSSKAKVDNVEETTDADVQSENNEPSHVNQQEAQQQEPQKEASTTTQKTIKSWKEAHRETCLSQSTLVASMRQVQENGITPSDAPTDNDKDVVLWETRHETMKQVLPRFQHLTDLNFSDLQAQSPSKVEPELQAKEAQKSVFSQMYSATGQMGSVLDTVTSFLTVKSDYDADLSSKGAAVTDDFDIDIDIDNRPDTMDGPGSNMEDNNDARLASDENILNMELLLQCLNYLKQEIEKQANDPQILTTAAMTQWLRECAARDKITSTTKLITNLPVPQLLYLLDVFVASGVVEKVRRQETLGKPDLILFADSHNPSTDVRVAIYDLDVAMQKIRTRRDTLEVQVGQALRLAKTRKTEGNKKAAMHELKRKKRFEAEIETLNNQLHFLDEQKLSLEGAVNTQHIHQAMRQTNETLQNLRLSREATEEQETSINDVLDSVAEEWDRIEEQNDALVSTLGAGPGADYDDEELLKELETAMENDIDEDELLAQVALLNLSDKQTTSAKKKPAKTTPAPKTADTAATPATNKKVPPKKTEAKKPKSPEKKLAAAVCL